MARTYGRIDVNRSIDDDWRALSFAEQGCYDFLLAHPKLSPCGVVDVKLVVWKRAARDGDTVVELLEALEERDYIRWDRETDELAIRTFVTHDKVLQNQNLGKGMWNSWAHVESEELRSYIVENLPDKAWEARFEPPFPSRENYRSNGGSNAGRDEGSDHLIQTSTSAVAPPNGGGGSVRGEGGKLRGGRPRPCDVDEVYVDPTVPRLHSKLAEAQARYGEAT